MTPPGLVKTPSEISSGLAGYSSLLKQVKKTLILGQQKIEQEKTLTYWETGKHIHEHILPHESRSEHYGKEIVERLAEDLDVSPTLLYQSIQLYRSFKNLHARVNSSLTWAHYRAAMRIPDEKKRLALTDQAAKEEWTSRELEVEVRNQKWSERVAESKDRKPARLPLVCLGPFYTYQVVRPETVHSRSSELLLDLGFSLRLEMDLFREKFPAGSIVTSVASAKSAAYQLKKVEGGEEDVLYTYKAFVENVLDGDTLKVEFQLGFGNRKSEVIRLCGIDCPEMSTAEGRAAKRFVESVLKDCEFITVKSIKTRKEKWGRYLGDMFFNRKASAAPVYLNQLLLDKGHAVKVRV